MVGDRFGGTSSSALVPSSFFFSTPTFTFAKEGMYFAMGSSSASLPSSTNIIAATLFGQREQSKDRLVRHRPLGDDILHAEELMIDRLAMLLDQKDRAGDLTGRHLVLEELADPSKLVPVEMRSGRNIEGTFL